MQKLLSASASALLCSGSFRLLNSFKVTSSGYLLLVVQLISQGQGLDQLLAVAPDGRLHLLQSLGQLGHGQLTQAWRQTGTS